MLRKMVDEIVFFRVLKIIALWLFVFVSSALIYLVFVFLDRLEGFFTFKTPIDFCAIALIAPVTMLFILFAVCGYVISSVISGKIRGYFGVIHPVLVAFCAFAISIAFYFNYSEIKFEYSKDQNTITIIR